LNIKGGIEGASIVCEDDEHGLVTKQRDFKEGEIITIPWSCGLESTTVSISRIETTVMDNGNIKEDAELNDMVAIMTFEDGNSILDIPKIYEAANKSLEVAVMELLAKYGWSIGGGILALLIAIGAIILCVCFYKLEKKCCLPVLQPFTEVRHKSREQMMRDQMKQEIAEWWDANSHQYQLRSQQSGEISLNVRAMDLSSSSSSSSIIEASPERPHPFGQTIRVQNTPGSRSADHTATM
jgi:hypothetical protein